MKLMISQLTASALATIVTTTVILFPTPSDLRRTLWPEPDRVEILAAGVQERSPIAIQRTPGLDSGAAAQAVDQGCFKDLDIADRAKLEKCANVVVEALAEISAYQQALDNRAATTADPHPTPTMERLRLAASEVCRAKWMAGESAMLGSPACGVTQLTLATE